jgi:hypothetical protein
MTYTFPDHPTGTTFNGVAFQLLINSVAKSLSGAVITMRIGNTIFSTDTGELVITDAANGRFQLARQIINLPVRNYPYRFTFLFSNGDIKEYLTGTWKITE